MSDDFERTPGGAILMDGRFERQSGEMARRPDG